MKKFIILLALGCVQVVGMSNVVENCFAQEKADPYTGVITAESVNIRSGPGTNFEILTKMNKEQLVLVYDHQFNWYKIKLSRTAKVYVHSNYISKENEFFGFCTRKAVNIRAGKGVNFNIIGQLNKQDRVEIIEKLGKWYKIFPLKECFAWVHEDYIKKRGPAKIYSELESAHTQAEKLLRETQMFEEKLIADKKSEDFQSAVLQKYKAIMRDYPHTQSAKVAKQQIRRLSKKSKAIKTKAQPRQLDPHRRSCPPQAQGKVMETGRFFGRLGTHKLISNKKTIYYLKSDKINLNDYTNYRVQVWGNIEKGKRSKVPLINVKFLKKIN